MPPVSLLFSSLFLGKFCLCDLKDFKIQNIVGSCDVKFPIRLELLECSAHSAFISVSQDFIQVVSCAKMNCLDSFSFMYKAKFLLFILVFLKALYFQ